MERKVATIVEQTEYPSTIPSIVAELRRLGMTKGMTVIVHSSLSAIGWVCGGAEAVVRALMEVVTEEGTIMMPTQSGELSDPAFWQLPPVPEEWWETVRETMPPYNPETTPTRGMGAIVESFRTFPDVKRSDHPVVSFAAWGKNAENITKNHSVNHYGLGEHSPLQKLYDLDGYVLLLGVNHESNTSLHLSECYAKEKFVIEMGAPIVENGKRIWKQYKEIDYDTDYFLKIGEIFQEHHEVMEGKIGNADCVCMKQRKLVDFATNWLNKESRETV